MCSTAQSRGRIERACTPIRMLLIWRLLRPRSSLLGMSRRYARACRWGGGILFAHEPHRAPGCYVAWVGMVTAPLVCGHRSRVASRHITTHMEGAHDGSGATRTGHGERGGSFLGSARGMPAGASGNHHMTAWDPTAPLGPISNRCTAARVPKAPDPPSSERTGTLFAHAQPRCGLCRSPHATCYLANACMTCDLCLRSRACVRSTCDRVELDA